MKSSKLLKQKTKKVSRFLFLFIFISILCIVVVFLTRKFFKITEIEIDGANKLEVVEIYDIVSAKYIGKSIFEIDEFEVRSFVEDSAFSLKFVDESYIFPNKLLIVVEPRSEVYTIVDISGSVFSLDASGYVFKVAEIGSVSDIRYNKPIEIGRYIDDPLVMNAFRYVQDDREVLIDGNEISLKLKTGSTVFLPKNVDESDILQINETLQKIIQKYTIENRGIEFIDMRFSKPVIKFK